MSQQNNGGSLIESSVADDFSEQLSTKKTKKVVGKYEFKFGVFMCLRHHLYTSNEEEFITHVWNDVHEAEGSQCSECPIKFFNGEEKNCKTVKSLIICLKLIAENNSHSGIQNSDSTIQSNNEDDVDKILAYEKTKDNSTICPLDPLKENQLLSVKDVVQSTSKILSRENSEIELIRKDVGESEIELTGKDVGISELKRKRKAVDYSQLKRKKTDLDFSELTKRDVEVPIVDEFEIIHNSDPLRVKCPKCSYTCNFGKQLSSHRVDCQKEQKEQGSGCPECGFSDSQRDVLRWHVSLHIGCRSISYYKCSYCDEDSALKSSIEKHISCEHLDKPISYDTKSERVSYLENTFKCFLCGIGFVWPKFYLQHLGKKHDLCSLTKYLEEKYVSEKDDKIPERITFPNEFVKEVLPNNDIKCKNSDINFESTSEKRSQLNTNKEMICLNDKAVGGMVHSCTMCRFETSYETTYKLHLDNHEKKITDGYKCGYCSFKDAQKSNIVRHLSKFHAEETELFCIVISSGIEKEK